MLRERDDAGVLGRFEAPNPTPNGPCLAQGPKVLAVVGDKDASELGRDEELLGVGRRELTEIVRGNDVVAPFIEQKTEGRPDVSVQEDVRHVR